MHAEVVKNKVSEFANIDEVVQVRDRTRWIDVFLDYQKFDCKVIYDVKTHSVRVEPFFKHDKYDCAYTKCFTARNEADAFEIFEYVTRRIKTLDIFDAIELLETPFKLA